MTAKEMFEALGYTYYKSNNMILYEISEINYFIFSPDKEITVGDYFKDEYELVKQYIEQLEQALDKACEVIDDITKDNATEFCPATQFDWLPSNCNEHTCENGTKECWKEWALQNRK